MGVGTGGVSSFLYTGVSGLGVSLPNGLSIPFPTLDLDFANTNSLDTRITFTRASNATYFDSSGVLQTAGNGVARFDYNPTTLESLGLLIEEQRTNLVTYSAEFDNAAWSKTNATVTANTIVAPDGTLTGDKLVATSTNGTHSITIGTVTSGTTYAFSLYAKAGEYSQLQFSGMGVEAQGFNTVYNLATQTVTSAPSGSSITAVGNGWYRCVLIVTASATAGPIIRIRNNSGSNSFAGNDSDGIYIWGAQLEAGSFPTSYIPTTTAAATRNADVPSMTGTDFSSWFNQSVSTFYAEYSIDATSTSTQASYVWGIRNTATASFDGYGVRSVRSSINTPTLAGRSGATAPTLNSNFGAVVADQLLKTAAVIDANFTLSVNSGLVSATNTVFGLDTQNQLMIGTADAGGTAPYQLNGHIRRIAYYPVRLSDDQLQALTR